MEYRREVDGLRALAVLVVIAFHADYALFSGGYVGVDVFFVISGYLISTIILSEKRAGTFSIRRFYERRARRILPSLFVILLCSIPFAWAWMPSAQFAEYNRSLLAVTFFVSNLFFWDQSGYFDSAVEEKPLLHTWSLAVEEQYYVVFPLLIGLLWPLGRRTLVYVFSLTAVASLAFSQWQTTHDPTGNFYWAQTRAWELLVGALCAVYLLDRGSPKANQWLSLTGIGLILFAAVSFDESTPFPSIYAVLPVAGTALIILFATTGTAVASLLSSPPFVGVGLISYSTYLWHQPLFAFARIRVTGEVPASLLLLLFVASLALGYLSYRLVETPTRDGSKVPTRYLIGGLAIMALGLTGWSLVLGNTDLQMLRFPSASRALVDPSNGNREVEQRCSFTQKFHPDLRFCEFGGGSEPSDVVAMYGDSHAESIYPTLHRALAKVGTRTILIKTKSKKCGELIGSYKTTISSPDDDYCYDLAASIARAANEMGASTLLVILRYTLRLYPIREHLTELPYDNGAGGVESVTYREYFVRGPAGRSFELEDKRASVLRFFTTLGEHFAGKTVILGPVPEVGWHVGSLNESRLLTGKDVSDEISTSYPRFAERNRVILEILRELDGGDRTEIYYPHQALCRATTPKRCMAQVDGVPLYSDDDHLNYNGAARVVEGLLSRVR